MEEANEQVVETEREVCAVYALTVNASSMLDLPKLPTMMNV